MTKDAKQPENNAVMAAYLDDINVRSQDRREIRRSFCITKLWANIMSMQLNQDKCEVFGPMQMAGVSTVHITKFKLLGETVGKTVIHKDRIAKFKKRCKRIKWIRGTPQDRANLIITSAIPCLYLGLTASHTARETIHDLRLDVMAAMRGRLRSELTKSSRIPEVVFTIMVPGHLMEPFAAIHYRVVLDFLRTDWSTELHSLTQLWSKQEEMNENGRAGVTKNLCSTLDFVGYKWSQPNEITTACGRTWRAPLRRHDEDYNEMAHILRDDIRSSMLKSATTTKYNKRPQPRRDTVGLQFPIDYDEHRKLMVQFYEEGDNRSAGILAMILSGGTYTADRRRRHHNVGDGICKFCEEDIETVHHRWWVCPRWSIWRPNEITELPTKFEMPPCMGDLGIVPYHLQSRYRIDVERLHLMMVNIQRAVFAAQAEDSNEPNDDLGQNPDFHDAQQNDDSSSINSDGMDEPHQPDEQEDVPQRQQEQPKASPPEEPRQQSKNSVKKNSGKQVQQGQKQVMPSKKQTATGKKDKKDLASCDMKDSEKEIDAHPASCVTKEGKMYECSRCCMKTMGSQRFWQTSCKPASKNRRGTQPVNGAVTASPTRKKYDADGNRMPITRSYTCPTCNNVVYRYPTAFMHSKKHEHPKPVIKLLTEEEAYAANNDDKVLNGKIALEQRNKQALMSVKERSEYKAQQKKEKYTGEVLKNKKAGALALEMKEEYERVGVPQYSKTKTAILTPRHNKDCKDRQPITNRYECQHCDHHCYRHNRVWNHVKHDHPDKFLGGGTQPGARA